MLWYVAILCVIYISNPWLTLIQQDRICDLHPACTSYNAYCDPHHTLSTCDTGTWTVMGSSVGTYNEYWACQFYDGEAAHDGGLCDCLTSLSGNILMD